MFLLKARAWLQYNLGVIWFWVAFLIFIAFLLVLDLGFFHRNAHEVRFREALAASAFWILLAVAFAVLVYQWHGKQSALEFSTGYLIELSLSVDNLFVFLVIFGYFRVPARLQHTVLFWGIVGALVLRGIFIVAGVALINRFHWIIYAFGAFLVYTGIHLAIKDDEDIHPEHNPFLKLLRRSVPMTNDYAGERFFVKLDGRSLATPLLAVLIVVETTDLLFAVDSIPAVLAISRDPFIVYTSNVFAILGLRSMFFALAGLMRLFHFLNYGLAFILSFVGVKMLLSNESAELFGIRLHYQIPIHWSLAVIGTSLALSILASLVFPQRQKVAGGREGQK